MQQISSFHNTSKMRKVTAHDILEEPSVVATFRKIGDDYLCMTSTSDVDVDAILSTLQKSSDELLPSGLLEVRSDGSIFAEGRFYAPECGDDGLYSLRKKFDKEKSISCSDRVLLCGAAKRDVINSGGIF